MPCYRPVSGFLYGDGTFGVVERGDVRRSLEVPCGSCVGCALSRSRQWSMRITHEASLFDMNSFITLTFEGDDAPKDLEYSYFQAFMRRVRKVYGPTRFFMCGEYGSKTGRPHFHAILFGRFFKPSSTISRPAGRAPLFRSAELEALWPHGFSSVGAVTPESAAYVAGYVIKKAMSGGAPARLDVSTGELVFRREFVRMSLKPGIGADWLKKFRSDVYDNDYVIMNGVKCRPPRYYDKKEAEFSPYDFPFVLLERERRSVLCRDDSTPERLAVREEVVRSKLSLKSKEF